MLNLGVGPVIYGIRRGQMTYTDADGAATPSH